MRTLLSEQFAPITSSIGFLERPLDEVVENFAAWQRGLYDHVDVSPIVDGFPDMFHRLEPLVHGTRPRQMFVGAGQWTAYFDCGRRGTDAVSVIGRMSRALRCVGLAIGTEPPISFVTGKEGGRHGGVSFELFGPTSATVLNYVRTISVSCNDGKWRFDISGTQQSYEEPDAYGSRNVRSRFTSDMLERYCQALGVDVFNPEFYGPAAYLVESAKGLESPLVGVSLKEAQEWLGIVPGAAEQGTY